MQGEERFFLFSCNFRASVVEHCNHIATQSLPRWRYSTSTPSSFAWSWSFAHLPSARSISAARSSWVTSIPEPCHQKPIKLQINSGMIATRMLKNCNGSFLLMVLRSIAESIAHEVIVFGPELQDMFLKRSAVCRSGCGQPSMASLLPPPFGKSL